MMPGTAAAPMQPALPRTAARVNLMQGACRAPAAGLPLPPLLRVTKSPVEICRLSRCCRASLRLPGTMCAATSGSGAVATPSAASASSKGFGPGTKGAKIQQAPSQKQQRSQKDEQVVKEAMQAANTKRKGPGKYEGINGPARPIDPEEAARGKVDTVVVKEWGSGDRDKLGELQVVSHQQGWYNSGLPLYDQLAMELRAAEGRGSAKLAGGPAVPFEKWSFAEHRYLQYLVDCHHVHSALEAAVSRAAAAAAASGGADAGGLGVYGAVAELAACMGLLRASPHIASDLAALTAGAVGYSGAAEQKVASGVGHGGAAEQKVSGRAGEILPKGSGGDWTEGAESGWGMGTAAWGVGAGAVGEGAELGVWEGEEEEVQGRSEESVECVEAAEEQVWLGVGMGVNDWGLESEEVGAAEEVWGGAVSSNVVPLTLRGGKQHQQSVEQGQGQGQGQGQAQGQHSTRGKAAHAKGDGQKGKSGRGKAGGSRRSGSSDSDGVPGGSGKALGGGRGRGGLPVPGQMARAYAHQLRRIAAEFESEAAEGAAARARAARVEQGQGQAAATSAGAAAGANGAAKAEDSLVTASVGAERAGGKLLAHCYVVQVMALSGGLRFGARAAERLQLGSRGALSFYTLQGVKDPLAQLRAAVNTCGDYVKAPVHAAVYNAVLEELPRALQHSALLMSALAHAN